MKGDKKPSKYQQEILKKFRTTRDNIVINAGAGAGKTTTILMLLSLTRGKSIFLAFNSSIVEELSKRINNKLATVSTLHSLGFKSIMSRFGKVKLSKGKTYRFIIKASKKHDWDILAKNRDSHFYIVNRLVEIYRLTLCGGELELFNTANKLGISANRDQVKHAVQVMGLLEAYNKNPKEVDFTDMVYIPAINNECPLPKVNTIFIDEAQDLNNSQHAMVDRIIKQGARFVAVGDPKQAIYSFAGSHSKSFNIFETKAKTITLPLPICYRCPGRVIDHANKVYDVLIPLEGIRDGEVKVGDWGDAESGDMVICRNLKPLLEVYFNLISEHKKCYIKGKDIGENLIHMISPYKGRVLEEMKIGLQKKLHEKINELLERGMSIPMKHPSYQNLLEKVQWIELISRNYEDVNAMISGLNTIFKDDSRDSIILSTIHKSKGLEADNIFLLNRGLIPSKFAQSEDQFIQEDNLLYVAITRAKESLTYCTI